MLKNNSLNVVENPRPHIMLMKSPVKSSATKIIYALDLLHVMLSRNVLAGFMRVGGGVVSDMGRRAAVGGLNFSLRHIQLSRVFSN